MADQNPFLTFVDPSDIPAISNEPTPSITPDSRVQHAIRTYYQDMNKVMGTNNARTMSDILAAARHEEEVHQTTTLVSPKNKTYLAISIMLLLGGFSALGFALYRNYSTSQTLLQAQQISLIRAETNTNVTLIPGEDFKNRDRISQAFNIGIPLQTINNIFFTAQTITGLQRLSFNDTIGLTGGIIPEGLKSVLDNNFMYGTYQGTTQLPFLIVRVTDYDDAFAGVRAWEPLMVDHLGFLFNLPQELQGNLNKSTFEDRVIANHAVRAVVYHAEQPLIFEETEIPLQEITSVEETVPTADVSPTVIAEEPAMETGNAGISQTTETTPDAIPTETAELDAINSEVKTTEPKPTYEEGDTVLMYTFLNEKTILFTTSESVLREILFRMANAQLLI